MMAALCVVVVLLIAAIFIQFRQVVELERDIERAIGMVEDKLVQDREHANSLYLSQATRIDQMEVKWAKSDSRVQSQNVALWQNHDNAILSHENALLSQAETQDNILKRMTVIEGAYVTATGLETELKPLQQGLTDLIAKTTEHPKDAKKEETPRVRKNFASARQAASDGPVV